LKVLLDHEQNLTTLPLPVVVLDSLSNALPFLIPFAPYVLALLQAPLPVAVHVIAPDGTVTLVV
jgi:hypothetical protein